MERLVANRSMNWLNINNKLPDSQYGYRAGRSTDTLLSELTARITHGLKTPKNTPHERTGMVSIISRPHSTPWFTGSSWSDSRSLVYPPNLPDGTGPSCDNALTTSEWVIPALNDTSSQAVSHKDRSVAQYYGTSTSPASQMLSQQPMPSMPSSPNNPTPTHLANRSLSMKHILQTT